MIDLHSQQAHYTDFHSIEVEIHSNKKVAFLKKYLNVFIAMFRQAPFISSVFENGKKTISC